MYLEEALFGIRFDVTGSELREHCAKRAEYHEGRVLFYAEEEKRFEGEVDELKEQHPTYSNKVAISNRERMTESKNHHENRARFFRFAVNHLAKDKYELRQAELQNFEMIPA